jgi:hypothetical protein
VAEVKTISGLKRGGDISREALYELWQQRHAPYVREHAVPEHYRITLVDSRIDGAASPLDGLAELWFRDDAHRASWFDEGSARGGDGFGKALEPGAGFGLVTSELVVVDGDTPLDAVKVTFLVRRKPEVPQAELFRHWRDVHAPNFGAAVERTDGALRYVISHSTSKDGPYDGTAEVWWRDEAARREGLNGFTGDGFTNLVDTTLSTILLGHEVVIVP